MKWRESGLAGNDAVPARPELGLDPAETKTMTTSFADPRALIGKANAALARGRLTAARKCVSAALEHSPESADLAMALGHLKFAAGGVPEALQEYLRAVKLAPKLAAAHACCALAFLLLAYPLEAKSAVIRALSLDPKESMARYVRARLYQDAQLHDSVRAVCHQILDRQRSNGTVSSFAGAQPGALGRRQTDQVSIA